MSGPRSSGCPSAATARAAEDPFAFPPFTHARRVRAEIVAGILRSRRVVPDDAFDEIYPDAVRRASPVHWTPVSVCSRAVELLALEHGARLLDVGAGAGKFCIIAAAMTGARVRGIERQPELAEAAREAARRLGVDVEIVNGSFESEDAERFDAAYLFNPFTETLLLPGTRDVPADRFAARAAADVASAENFLRTARIGMRVVTFCGFGGTVPPDYTRLTLEVMEAGVLELWEKR